MLIAEIYKYLQNQEGCLIGAERQIQDLLDTNAKNLQDSECLDKTTNRIDYFRNQHQVFNVLMEVIGDMKITNGYILLEIESQLRGDRPRVEYKPKENESDLQMT